MELFLQVLLYFRLFKLRYCFVAKWHLANQVFPCAFLQQLVEVVRSLEAETTGKRPQSSQPWPSEAFVVWPICHC